MKSKHIFPIIIIFSLLLVLLLPLMTSSAQNDEQEPDFLITLALMAVADDRMDGVMGTDDLANLRTLVDEYYSNKSIYQMTSEAAETLTQQKKSLLSALDKKIDDQKNRVARAQTALLFSLSRIGDQFYVPDVNDPNSLVVDEQALNNRIMGILAGGHKPDQNLLDLLKQRLDQDEQGNLEKDLDGHVADSIEGGDQLLSQTSDTVYDFSAGLTKEAYLEKLSQTKPLVFINNGARDVTVSIEYYAPPKGLAISAPGLNLTVAKENQVTATGFPQGNYTFCAHWQTDLDTNNDGIKDYDRMVTHIWLSSASPDDPDMAEEVYVNSVGTATPTGRCDGFVGEAPKTEELMTEIFMTEDDPQISEVPPQEATDTGQDADFWDQGEETQEAQDAEPTDVDQPSQEPQEETPTQASPQEVTPTESPPQETGFTLTPAELANQGFHNYELTCENEGYSDTRSVSVTWEFTEVGVSNVERQLFYAKVSSNVYQNDYPTIITFTTDGYLVSSYYTETSSEGVTTTSETNCTAIFK